MLKKLFIPHQANNYQPQALHPHRLLFHGVSAIVIKAFIIIVVLALPTSAWLTPDVMTAESQKIITLTNDLRVQNNLPELQENNLLNEAAFNKVEDMLVNQYFAHLSPDNKNMLFWLKASGYGYAVAGENLAMGFSSAQNVVKAWTKSKTHYANIIDPDFKEIGVAMVSGNFKERSTTMVAQYFGTPKASLQAPIIALDQPATVSPARKIRPVLVARQSIKGVKITYNNVVVDTDPPVIDLAQTKIWVTQPVGQKDKIISVEAYLSPDTTQAQVGLNDIIIDLNQDSDNIEKWTGSTIIQAEDNEQIFSPIILANLTASDSAGNILNTDIDWANFQEIQPSLVQQYLFIKNSPNRNISALFQISRIYLLFMLIICILALALNIFIEIKKQHPHLIASAVGLITLLVFLLIL